MKRVRLRVQREEHESIFYHGDLRLGIGRLQRGRGGRGAKGAGRMER